MTLTPDIFHGDVLHINDIITFQGRSIDELKTALAESVEVYLEYCEKKAERRKSLFPGLSMCVRPRKFISIRESLN